MLTDYSELYESLSRVMLMIL